MKQRNQYQNLHPNGLSLEHHDDAGAGLVILVRSVGLKIDVTSWRNVNFDFQSPGDFPTTIRHKIPVSPTLRTRMTIPAPASSLRRIILSELIDSWDVPSVIFFQFQVDSAVAIVGPILIRNVCWG